MVLAIGGVSIPSFWLGLMLILFFSVRLKLLPVAGAQTWQHLVLPAITLGFGASAILARLTQRSVETLGLSQGTPVYAVIKTVGFDRQTLGAGFRQANGADTAAVPI